MSNEHKVPSPTFGLPLPTSREGIRGVGTIGAMSNEQKIWVGDQGDWLWVNWIFPLKRLEPPEDSVPSNRN